MTCEVEGMRRILHQRKLPYKGAEVLRCCSLGEHKPVKQNGETARYQAGRNI